MALFNYATRELSAKIVYYGPGLSGKTTNIEMVHKMLRPEQKGRLISLPTETDRTLFFDFLPIELGQIKGFKVRFHLYTVPGQVFYNATRRLVLQGVDGVVFVADSQREMINGNMESLKNLMDNLSSYGKKLEELPFVLQYNKRDLRNVAPVAELDTALNFLRVPTFEAVAPTGKGVTETLVGISRMVFAHLRKTLLMPGEMAAHDDLGDLADAQIGKTFATQEARAPRGDLRRRGDPGTRERAAGAPPRPSWRSIWSRRRSGLPTRRNRPWSSRSCRRSRWSAPRRCTSRPGAPAAAAPTVSVEATGGELAFLKFEAPFVARRRARHPSRALFLDGAGNSVRVRIRVTIDEERP